MRQQMRVSAIAMAVGAWVALAQAPAWAFDSGSDGSLGALTPSANTVIQLPPDGVLHYTEVSIPSGVTVTFSRNERNTAVHLLASGNVTISGTINVSGSSGSVINKKHITTLGGIGGPGASAGASGRFGTGLNAFQFGLGPGPGPGHANWPSGGASPVNAGQKNTATSSAPNGGSPYATLSTAIMHGGSGGGSIPTNSSTGTGGGGGGGVITIAANGTIALNGSVLANGGGANSGGVAGGAGVIRLVASEVVGNGTLSARGSAASCSGACGGDGLILIEAWDVTGTITTSANPAPYFGTPTLAVLPYPTSEEPTLDIAAINGQAPNYGNLNAHPLLSPTLTLNQGSQVVVDLLASHIPVGSIPQVIVNTVGNGRQVVSGTPLEGSLLMSTSTVTINIPAGTRVGVIEAWVPTFDIEPE